MPVRGCVFLTLVLSWLSTLALCQPVTEGLVSYWTFDSDHVMAGIVIDVWGGNDGSIVGEPETVEGRNGDGLRFDGINDAVDCGTPEALTSILDAVTLEAWVKDERDAGMVAGCSRAGNSTWMMGMNGSGRVIFDLWDGANQVWPDVSVAAVEAGEWRHVVGTYDGDTARIYIDGELDLVHAFPGDLVYNGERFQIGRRGGGDQSLKFAIDDLRVYNRALDEADIQQNLTATSLTVRPAEKLSVSWAHLKRGP
jgi:hypothetical protein